MTYSAAVDAVLWVVIMSVVSGALRKPALWLRRRYAVACARDDARRVGYRVPQGVWACADCRFVSFDAIGFHRHMQLTHAV